MQKIKEIIIMNNNKTKTLSIITIGESAVGKSALIRRFNTNEYTQDFYTTLGTDFISKQIEVGSDEVTAQIWDTAGQERFMTIAKSFYQRADGILLVYDMTRIETFEKVANWMENIKDNIASSIPKYLIANKKDLEEDRQITIEEGKKKAKDYNMNYFETSAKTGENVEGIFQDIVTDAYNTKRKRKIAPSIILDEKEHSSSKEQSCCK